MAQKIVGYAGEGKARRAVYADEGPARGRVGGPGGNPLSRLGVADVPDRVLVGGLSPGEPGGAAARIERRQISEDERSARRSRDDAPPTLVVRHMAARPHRTLAESRARGAERAGFTPGATKPVADNRRPGWVTPARLFTEPDPPREGPMAAPTPAPPPLSSTALGRYLKTPPAPVQPFDVLTPCEDCAHRVVCSIRPILETDVGVDLGAVVLPGGVRVAAVSIDCDYFLAQDGPQGVTPAPTPNDASVGAVAAPVQGRSRGASVGQGWRKLRADRDAREMAVIAAVRSTSTQAEAGKQLGVSGKRIQQLVAEMRGDGRLPADVNELMRTRRLFGGRAPAVLA